MVSIFGYFFYICMQQKRYFSTYFLKEADRFLKSLDLQTQKKVLLNIRYAQYRLDPELFKKIRGDIWEFRTNFSKTQIRFLAFWDKRKRDDTQVILTHGFVKKSWEIAEKEIKKAESARIRFLQ